MLLFNTEHFWGSCALCLSTLKAEVVLKIQHPFETSMNVVPSDDCQNVLPNLKKKIKINIILYNKCKERFFIFLINSCTSVHPEVCCHSGLQTGDMHESCVC